MKKIILTAVLLVAGANYASACVFDSNFDKCMSECTSAGKILYPVCALGASAPTGTQK